MAGSIEGDRMTDPTPRFTVYRAAVAAVQELAPRFVRITLGGGGLADYECEGLAPKVKLFLPSGPGSSAIPEVGMSGFVYPPGAPIPVVRTGRSGPRSTSTSSCVPAAPADSRHRRRGQATSWASAMLGE